jgi:hypothetical protein
MHGSFWLLAHRSRLLEWLLMINLVVFFVASQAVMNVESRIFADPLTHVSNASHPVAIELKGQTFFVSQDDKESHQLVQRVSFGAMVLLFAGICFRRLLRRDGQRP